MVTIPLKVWTSSESGALSTPVSFILLDRTFLVTAIVDAWHGSDHACYKVMADDGNLYVIRHDLETDAWELVQLEVVSGV